MKVSGAVLVILTISAVLAASAGLLIILLNVIAFSPSLWASRLFGILVGALMISLGVAIEKMLRDIRKGMKSSAKVRFL